MVRGCSLSNKKLDRKADRRKRLSVLFLGRVIEDEEGVSTLLCPLREYAVPALPRRDRAVRVVRADSSTVHHTGDGENGDLVIDRGAVVYDDPAHLFLLS